MIGGGGRFREAALVKKLSGLDWHRPLSRPVMFRRKREKATPDLRPVPPNVNTFS
jgi:hypothetical protein